MSWLSKKGGGGTVDTVARGQASAASGKVDNIVKNPGDIVKAGSTVFVNLSDGTTGSYSNKTAADITIPATATDASLKTAGLVLAIGSATDSRVNAIYKVAGDKVSAGSEVFIALASGSVVNYRNPTAGDLTVPATPDNTSVLAAGFAPIAAKENHLHSILASSATLAGSDTIFKVSGSKLWKNKVASPNITLTTADAGWLTDWEEAIPATTGLTYVTVKDNDTLVAKQFSVAETAVNVVTHLTAPPVTANSWYSVINAGKGVVDIGGIQIIGEGALEFTASKDGSKWVLTSREGTITPSSEKTSKAFTQTAHGFKVGQAVYHDGTKFALADSTTEAKSEVVGIVSSVNSADSFDLCSEGYVQNIVQTGLSAGVVFLNGTPGNLTATAPTTGFLKAVMLLDSGTSGWVLHRPAFEIGATGTANNPSGLLVQPFGATFATLPTVPADASATIVYHTVLTADDIGTGTALAPQYQKGIYKSGANAAAGWTFETNFGGAGANTVLDAWLDSSDSNHATKGQISFQQVKDAILEEYQYFNTGTWDANNSPKAKNQYVAGSSGVDVSNFPYGLAKPAAFISEYYGDSSQGLQRLQIFGAPATSRGVWSRIYQGGTNWTPWQREGAFWEYTPDAATPGTEYYVIDGWVAINDGDLLKLNSTDTKTAVRAAPVSDWSNVPAITVSAAAKAAGWVIEGTQPLSGTQVIEFVPDTMFKKWLLRKSDSAVTTKTIHDLGNASAIALKSADNLAECHLEGGAGYSFNTADLADGLSFRLINTSTTDYTTAATFTGFDGVYERVGDTVVEITGITSFALKQNEWRDVTITKNGAFWYANIIGGLPDAVAVTTLTKAQVEDSADTSSGLVSGERLAQAIAKNVAPMTGSTGATDGVAGLVPKPLIADELKFLRGDGTWASTVVDITGQYLGSAGTFAGLPVIDAIGDPATNGDWAILSVADIGIGTAEAPEFERGVYVYDGTKFTFAVALSSDLSPLTQTQAESNTDTTPGLITGELLAQSISKNVKADLETLLGMPVSDKDLGTFAGDTIPDDSTIKAAFQALETKLETYKVTGRYIGSASTYSTLPTTSTATGSAINGDWVALNADDVGTGTAVAPQYPKGVYINDGTKYSFAFALAAALVNLTQAQAEDKASTVFGMVSGERLAQAVDKNLLKPYVHADKTTLAPAVPALPTITEVTNFCNAKTPKVRNQFIYYTNSDVATDTVLFAWYIDGNGLVKLIMDSRNNIIQNWTANSPVWPGCIRRFASPQIGGNVIHAVYKVTLQPGFTRASVDATELGNWDLVAQPSIGGWLSSTLFLINTRIINNNSIYRCQATHTSGTSFTFSESATNWSRDSATLPIVNVINNTVVIRGNSFYHLNSPSAITITIGANQFDLFMVKNTSGFAHTITPPAGETINGGANFVSSILNSSHIFTKVGTNWLTTQIDTPSTIRTGTLHDLSAATVIELDKVSNGLEAHFEGGLGYNINASSCNDGDIFYLLNTAGSDQTGKLTFSNFAGAYLRNGANESSIASPYTIKKGTKYIATVTVNGGSRYLNVVELGAAGGTAFLAARYKVWSNVGSDQNMANGAAIEFNSAVLFENERGYVAANLVNGNRIICPDAGVVSISACAYINTAAGRVSIIHYDSAGTVKTTYPMAMSIQTAGTKGFAEFSRITVAAGDRFGLVNSTGSAINVYRAENHTEMFINYEPSPAQTISDAHTLLTPRNITGSITSVGYDGVTLAYQIPLAAGFVLNTVSLNGTTTTDFDANTGIVRITPNGSAVAVTHTTKVGSTFNSPQIVGVRNFINENGGGANGLSMGAANAALDLGTVLQEGDRIQFDWRFNSNPAEDQSFDVIVRAGTTRRSHTWTDRTEYWAFPSTLTSKVGYSAAAYTSVPSLLAVTIFRPAENKTVVPTGTTVATAYTITVNGGANGTFTGHESIGPETFYLTNMQVNQEVDVFPTVAGVTLRNRQAGMFSVDRAVGGGNLALTGITFRNIGVKSKYFGTADNQAGHSGDTNGGHTFTQRYMTGNGITTANGSTFTLSGGIYRVRYSVTHHKGGLAWSARALFVDGGEVCSIYTGDDGSNWPGGGDLEWIVDCTSASHTVQMKRTASTNNGNVDCWLAIEREEGYALPEGYQTREACALTSVNGNFFNGTTSLSIPTGTGQWVSFQLGANQELKSCTGSAGLTVGTVDMKAGAAWVTVANGTTSGTLTVNIGARNPVWVLEAANSGVAVTIGSIQLRMAPSGNRNLQIASATGAALSVTVGSVAPSSSGASPAGIGLITLNLDAAGTFQSPKAHNFGAQGQYQQVMISDTVNNRVYFGTMEVGAGFSNNVFAFREI